MLCGLALAKVNLFLHVIKKNNDGYHLLESLFVKSNLYDRITVEESEALHCEVRGADIPDNIVVRAAYRLLDFCGFQYGAKIVIDKKIPLAAGLGGGSADAAATLKLLIKLWNIKISQADLFEIARSLGADIPFCLQDHHACFVTGIGDVMRPVVLNQVLHLVFVNPGYHIMSGDAYRGIKSFSVSMGMQQSEECLSQLIIDGRNDLAEAAHALCPALDEVRDALLLQANVLSVRMSGSGSTYFAIFSDQLSAQRATRNLLISFPQWQVWSDSIFI